MFVAHLSGGTEITLLILPELTYLSQLSADPRQLCLRDSGDPALLHVSHSPTGQRSRGKGRGARRIKPSCTSTF